MDMLLNRKKNGMPLVKDSEAARYSESNDSEAGDKQKVK
jgi:hypothetical protein